MYDNFGLLLNMKTSKQEQEITTDILENGIIRLDCLSGESVTELSCKRATRQDALDALNKFDIRLAETRVRLIGICPTRRKLYSQLFDELIRQVCLTPHSAERGLMLIKVRDEVNMTMTSYKSLLANSVNKFAVETINSCHVTKAYLHNNIEAIELENRNIITEIRELEDKSEREALTHVDIMESTQRKHDAVMEELKRTNSQLTIHLDAMNSLKTKHGTVPAPSSAN